MSGLTQYADGRSHYSNIAPGAVLRSGALTVRLEDDCSLADVRVGGIRALDRLSLTVRDDAWGTPTTRVEWIRGLQDETGFDVLFRARIRSHLVDVAAEGRYQAHGGTLTAHIELRAQRRQALNRKGFVLLHPPELSAMPLIINPDTAPVTIAFAAEVSPGPLASDVRALISHLPGGGRLEIRSLTADCYEIEDHRNWTDAGWKSYSPPLADPHPLILEDGAISTHGVAIEAVQGVRTDDLASDVSVSAHAPTEDVSPRLGATMTRPPGAALPGSFIGVELIDGDEGVEQWVAARAASSASGKPLELTLATARENVTQWVERIAQAVADGISIGSVTVVERDTHTSSDPLLVAFRAGWSRAAAAEIRVGGGTRAYFAELNRSNQSLAHADFLAYSVCPQVHHSSDELILDTLFGQTSALLSAHRLSDGRPVRVGPVTWQQRIDAHNAQAAAPTSARAVGDADDAVRAIFLLGTVAANLKAESIELFAGDDEEPSVRRVWRILEDSATRPLCAVENSDPRRVVALAWIRPNGSQRLVIGNRTPHHLRVMTQSGAVTLNPYAFTVMDQQDPSHREQRD